MSNKVAIITGASKGIGECLAYHFAEKGYDLLLLARSNDLINKVKLKSEQVNNNINVEAFKLDITSFSDLNYVVNEFCQRKNSIDILVNNAGYVKRGTSEIDEKEVMQMVEVNLQGLINITNIVAPFMKKQGYGQIINMSSRNAKIARSFLGVYAATKAGVLAYNEALYKELAEFGIKVTAIVPGFVNTQMTSELALDRASLIQPCDISYVVDFLIGLSPSVALKEICLEAEPQIGKYA